MKKIKLVLVIVIGVVFISISSHVYAGYKMEADRRGGSENKNTYIDKDAKKKRNIRHKSKKISVKYNRTEVMPEKEIENQDEIEFGKYDIYKDNNNAEYIYLSDTDTYCGFREDGIGTNEYERTIDENRAKEIAKQYLKSIVETSEDYQLGEVLYQDWGYYYSITFIRCVDGIKTDEEIRIWVNTEGTVISYSNFMNGCYDGIKLNKEELKQAKLDTKDNIEDELGNTDYDIENQYITFKDGKLVVETEVTYFITDSINKVNYEDTYTVELECD